MGMPAWLRPLAVVGVAWHVTACVPIYIPPAAHAPMLSDEGEIAVQAHVGATTADLNAAVAVVDLEDIPSRLVEQREVNNILVVLVTSNRGLAGLPPLSPPPSPLSVSLPEEP